MQRCVDLPCGQLRQPFNLRQQFCERGYGNVTYVGAHNSYAVGVNNRESYVTVHLPPAI